MDYSLTQLLELRLAVEIIPRVLYFASIPQRPPDSVCEVREKRHGVTEEEATTVPSPCHSGGPGESSSPVDNNNTKESSKGGILDTQAAAVAPVEVENGGNSVDDPEGIKAKGKGPCARFNCLAEFLEEEGNLVREEQYKPYSRTPQPPVSASNRASAAAKRNRTSHHRSQSSPDTSMPHRNRASDKEEKSDDKAVLPVDRIAGGILHTDGYYFSVDADSMFQYHSFFADFGPLDLKCLTLFVRRLSRLMAVSAGYKWQRSSGVERLYPPQPDAGSNVSDGTDMSPPVPVVFCSGLSAANRANAACLLGGFCVTALGWSTEQVHHTLLKDCYPPLPTYRDASCGASNYPLTVVDVLRGVARATKLGWIDMRSNAAWAELIRGKEHNYSWIVPHKILALSSPEDAVPHRTATVYARLLQQLHITMTVQLNDDPLYAPKPLLMRGIQHINMAYPDGTAPSDAVLKKFLKIVETELGELLTPEEQMAVRRRGPDAIPTTTPSGELSDPFTVGGAYRGLPPARTARKEKKISKTHAHPVSRTGAIAVHCRAGLGRTGTMIAVYMMRHYGFTAREAIGWTRVCRPGSITGIQQQYLDAVERRLTPSIHAMQSSRHAATARPEGDANERTNGTFYYQAHGTMLHDAGAPEADSIQTFSFAVDEELENTDVYGNNTNANNNNCSSASFIGTPSVASPLGDAPPTSAFQRVASTASGGRPQTSNGIGATASSTSGRPCTASGPQQADGNNNNDGNSGRPQTSRSMPWSPSLPSVPQAAASTSGSAMQQLVLPTSSSSAPAGVQRYETAEVVALLCDPRYVPKRSLLKKLKYPSSYFLAMEQARPLGTAVALESRLKSRRRNNAAVGTVNNNEDEDDMLMRAKPSSSHSSEHSRGHVRPPLASTTNGVTGGSSTMGCAALTRLGLRSPKMNSCSDTMDTISDAALAGRRATKIPRASQLHHVRPAWGAESYE